MFGTDNTNDQIGNTGSPQVTHTDPAPLVVPPSQPAPSQIDEQAAFIETPVAQPSLATSTPKQVSQAAPSVGNDALLELKQQALQSLAPMVGQLNQTPEEKFKTLMMLIQASDNTSLVGEAYETAKLITDEKERAQALIDVVNEINYFTQQHNSGQPAA
jgi:hypothetical protein